MKDQTSSSVSSVNTLNDFLADHLKPQREKSWTIGLRGSCLSIQTNIMKIRILETLQQGLINAGSTAWDVNTLHYLYTDAHGLPDSTIRLSHEEFSRYNQSGILLGDGSGYLATPTAYHDLHCIRFLHETVYPNYYFPNDTEKKQLGRDAHARTSSLHMWELRRLSSNALSRSLLAYIVPLPHM